MKYCTIRRPATPAHASVSVSPLCEDEEKSMTLGQKILMAQAYGVDIGSPVVVQYDAEDSDSVDALTDPNFDVFDIAELGGSIDSDTTQATNV